MINWGEIPLGTVVPFPFATYGKTNGESITLTGLATTDIEVYKGTSVTQRASDAGYALIDTDGIDIDGTTGIHGFSIDTGDNTDAGFYVAGSLYWVVVSAVTVDSQTVNFIAGTFRIVAAESVAGVKEVDITHFNGTAGTFSGGRAEVNTSHIAGSAVSTSSAQIGVNVIQAAGTAWGSGAITAASIASDAITAAKIATGAVDADAIAADAVTEIQAGLSTLDAAGVRTAVGLASANLDTQLTACKGTTQITEAYAANGVAPTRDQAMMAIHQMLMQFAISGTSLTVKKLDNSTTAFVVTLDDASTPTSAVRT